MRVGMSDLLVCLSQTLPSSDVEAIQSAARRRPAAQEDADPSCLAGGGEGHVHSVARTPTALSRAAGPRHSAEPENRKSLDDSVLNPAQQQL